MSASREKKQRQNAGPDPKNAKVQQEQAARKRQTIIYSVTGGVVAVLIVALLVWRSGFFQSRAAAASVGGETLTAAELSYYYNGVRQTTAMYAAYGINNFDSSKPDGEQFYNEAENKTYRDYFLEAALESAQEQLALAREAMDAGLTEANVKEDLDNQIASTKSQAASYSMSYNAYLKAVYGDYMTSAIYEKLTTRALMASTAAEAKHDELYSGYAQSDLDAYYQENADTLDTVEYSILYFSVPSVDTTDDQGNQLDDDAVDKLKAEAQADTKKKAEEALKAVESGNTFTSQIEKYDLNTSTSHDHAKVVGTDSISSYFRDQLFSLDKDGCDLVETDTAYYVISFHDRYLEDELTRDVRHILIRAETTTDDSGAVVAPTDEAWAAAKEKMDAVQAEWEGGNKSEDTFASLANQYSDDGDGTTGGLYERSYNGGFTTEFNDWVFDSSRGYGDVGLVQHVAGDSDRNKYYGYHLIFYIGENEPVWMGTVRSTLSQTAYQEWVDGLTEGYPTAQLDGAKYFGK